MYGDDEKMSRDQVWSELGKRNWKKVVITFSGGNDSGGADGIEVTNGDDDVFEVPDNGHVYKGNISSFNEETKRYETRAATDQEHADSDLMVALTAPIFEQYYSFAGEYEVEGTVTWNCLDRTVVMSANESRTEWERTERAL